jgi:hypothetical protein
LQESRDLASAQARLNQINQIGPLGSLTFSGPVDEKGRRDPFNTTATTALSPAMQAQLEQQQLAQRLTGQRGIDMAGALPGAGQPVIGGDPFSLGRLQTPQYGAGAATGGQGAFSLLQMLGGQNTADAFSGERDRVEQATFDRMASLLNPEFARQEGAMLQRLSNQGLPQASRAYASETGRFDDTRNRALESAALSAVLAGGTEQSRLLADLLGTSQVGMGQAQQQRQNLNQEALTRFGANTDARLSERGVQTQDALANRQIPFNEMLSLLGMQTPATAGDFFAPGQTQVQNMATPSQGSFLQQMMPGLIQGGATLGAASLMAPVAPAMASDRRLKTDIKRVGQTDDGLPVYTFRYKSGGPVQMGVMAQDVAEVKPEAVGLLPGGYLAVDYGRL